MEKRHGSMTFFQFSGSHGALNWLLASYHLPPANWHQAGFSARPPWDSYDLVFQTITIFCLIRDLSFMQILVATIAFLLPSAEYSSVETDKKVGGASAKCSPACLFFYCKIK